MLRDHGQVKKYFHDLEGYNGRLDAIQAGILQAKLPHLEEWNKQRRDRAADYNRLLSKDHGLSLPYEPSWSRAVYHLYVIRTCNREGLMNHLKEAAHRDGNPLSDSVAFAKGICVLELCRWRLSCRGTCCRRNRVFADVSSTHLHQQMRVVEAIAAYHTRTLLDRETAKLSEPSSASLNV